MSRTDAVRRRRDGSTSRAPHAGPADAGSGKVDGCGRGADEPRRKGRRAAFFDVDGTITKSNVVVPFFMYRLQKLPRWMRAPYTLLFLVRAVMYMVIDWMSRSAFNRIFYACYRGQDVHDTGAFLSSHVWRDYMLPNVFPEALSELRRLKGLGFAIVLVTGSLDLVVRPLAEYIGAEFVISASLEDELGGPREPRDSSRRRFTGRLADEPLAGDAKARRIHELSDEHGLDLAALSGVRRFQGGRGDAEVRGHQPRGASRRDAGQDRARGRLGSPRVEKLELGGVRGRHFQIGSSARVAARFSFRCHVLASIIRLCELFFIFNHFGTSSPHSERTVWTRSSLSRPVWLASIAIFFTTRYVLP